MAGSSSKKVYAGEVVDDDDLDAYLDGVFLFCKYFDKF